MAKLSARGRTELCRVSKVLPDQEPGVTVTRFRALMSDGVILHKTSWKYDSKDRSNHDTGWKVGNRLKPGVKPENVIDAWRDAYLAQGYTLVSQA